MPRLSSPPWLPDPNHRPSPVPCSLAYLLPSSAPTQPTPDARRRPRPMHNSSFKWSDHQPRRNLALAHVSACRSIQISSIAPYGIRLPSAYIAHALASVFFPVNVRSRRPLMPNTVPTIPANGYSDRGPTARVPSLLRMRHADGS
ncbi:hypothetical protein B0H13DRAFT_2325252 [Mycena leptocephala]|nr:hypothetical protein B0H13DRAFT_2325252 [Mycena leptocephala]